MSSLCCIVTVKWGDRLEDDLFFRFCANVYMPSCFDRTRKWRLFINKLQRGITRGGIRTLLLEVRLISKMSAPLSTRLPNKNVYNFTLQSLFVQIFVLNLTVFVSRNQNFVTDIVNNTFLSCKIIAGFLMVTNIYFGTRLAQMQSSSSYTGSNVAKVSEVPIIWMLDLLCKLSGPKAVMKTH